MTNAPKELDGGIDSAIIPQEYLDLDYRYVKPFAFSNGRNCWHRSLFLDLDVTIFSNIAPLLAGDEDFRTLGRFRSRLEQTTYEAFRLSWRRGNICNSSMIYMRTGSLPFVWREFNLEAAQAIKRRTGLVDRIKSGLNTGLVGACRCSDRARAC